MKKISKLLTALVVTAMMFSFFGASVFAASPVSSAPTIVKSIANPDEAKLTDADTYTFTLIYTGKGNVGNNVASDPTGTSIGDSQILTLTGKATQNLVSGMNQPSLTAYNFTTPGTYDFTLQETAVSNSHVNLNDTVTNLRAVVTYATDAQTGVTNFNTLEVTWYLVTSENGKEALDNDSFTVQNTMKGDENYTTATISKIVKGNSAVDGDSFSVPVTVQGISGVVYTVEAPDGNPETITAGTTTNFTLKAGQSIEIKGLLAGTDSISVSENLTNEQADKYVKTFAYRVGDGSNQNYTEGQSVSVTEASKYVFEITNTCDNSFTGYVTTILPYAIIAVIAIAGIVIVRKRRVA